MKDLSKLFVLVVVVATLHLAAAVTAPMLAGEAYYWLWGKYPASGYFDHPPMVAVAAALCFGWVDGSPLAARSSSLLLAGLTIPVIYAIARSLYPEGRTAWRSALLFAAIPLFHAAGMLIQPDTSLIFFMSLTWFFFWKASRPGSGWSFWLLSGVTAGCALLTKFHAWVLLPPLYLFLLLTPGGRERLKSPAPWAAIVVALIVLSPNLVWNAQHDWLNYTYQWRRSDLPESRFDIENVLIYVLGPSLTLSPVVYALMLGGVWKGIREWLQERDERTLFLLCAGLPLPLFLGLLSFVVTISLHWPSSGYIPLIILTVAYLERGGFMRIGYRAAVASAVGLTALGHVAIHTVELIPAGLHAPIRPDDINTTRLKAEWHGWPEIGALTRNMLEEANQTAPTVLMAPDWHLASSIAFYSKLPKEVFVYNEFDAHNYKLWMRERDNLKGMNAIILIQKSDPYEKHSRMWKKVDKYVREVSPLFEEVQHQASIIVYTDGAVERYWGVDTSRPRYRELIVIEGRGFRGQLREE